MSYDSRLRRKALRLLARGAHSRQQLALKLTRRHPRDQVEELLDDLQNLGLLDDVDFASQRALLARRRRKWGNLKIEADLRGHGIDAKIVDRAVAQAEAVYPERQALREVISQWLKRHATPVRPQELKRLFDHCNRRGFKAELVREELEPLRPASQ